MLGIRNIFQRIVAEFGRRARRKPIVTPPSLQLANGTSIPVLGLGTWGLRDGKEYAFPWAIKLGYRHIDTAAIYGTEYFVGRAVRESGVPRSEFFITTKLGDTEQGYESALQAFDESLRNLHMDFVDLYLIHRPHRVAENVRRESWEALETIYESGRAKAIGVSNYELGHLKEMERYARISPMVNQIERHPFFQQRELVEYCHSRGIVVTNYSPIVRGKKLSDTTLDDISKKYGKSVPQILIRWGLQHGNIVIPKAAKYRHLADNIDVFNLELQQEDMATLDALESGSGDAIIQKEEVR